MPGTATVNEATGQPLVNTLADFSLAVVGYSSDSAVSAGAVSPAYSKPGAAVADLGQGDMVDCVTQALTTTNGNPRPPPVICYTTPATTAGSYGTIDISGVTGTCRPTNNTTIAPCGTYQPRLEIKTGGTVGTTGMEAYASLGAAYGPTKTVLLGTGTSYDFPASDGWGVGGQAGFVFAPAASTLTALYTKVTLLQTTMTGTGHFVLTTSSVHLAADTTDDTALAAVPAATTPATCVTLFNACKTYLAAHGANLTYHTIADATLATALAAIPTAVNVADVDLYLDDLIAAYNAHRVLTTGTVHGSADSTNTITAYTPIPGTLVAGDVMQTTTVPPQWAAADLYTAASGPTPASGALAALANSTQLVRRVVITEPVAAADFSTLVAGLNYALARGHRWRLICRFRDIGAAETDAAYITAFQAFVAACLDSRITYLAGDGLMSDAYTGRVYKRTFMAAYLARLQGMIARPGLKGERLAQNAGWVDAGPLEGFSLRDSDGNPVGHDEGERGGIVVSPGAAKGGGMACYYMSNPARAGTYIDDGSTVAYDVGEAILTPQDRDVANALESVAVGIALGYIGGADIIGDGSPRTMDEVIAQALEAQIQKAAKDNHGREFANPDDPNFASIDSEVVVTGATVDITGSLNVKLYAYARNITLSFLARR
jgi:hypothetical protein